MDLMSLTRVSNKFGALGLFSFVVAFLVQNISNFIYKKAFLIILFVINKIYNNNKERIVI